MEQVQLTTKEIFEYVIKTLDNEVMGCSRQINFDPSVIHSTITLNGLSREEQLEAIYDRFISIYYLSTDNILYSNMVSYSDYAPFSNLQRIVTSAKTKTHDELTDNECKAVWLYNKIESAITSTVSKMSYKELSIDNGCTLSVKALPRKTIDYREESEHFFKTCLSERPDKITVNLIYKLKVQVEQNIAKEADKAKLNGNISKLINDARDTRVSIYTDITFGEEWFDDGTPTINQTDILCKWESKCDYELFIEKLLIVDICEKSFLQLSFYDYDKQRIDAVQKERMKEEQAKNARFEKLTKTTNSYICNKLSPYISESNLADFICSIHLLFRESKTPNIRAINKIAVLKQGDIRALCYNIWDRYIEEGIKLDQLLLAEFMKLQFPSLFKEADKAETIKKHIKRAGKIIKIEKI